MVSLKLDTLTREAVFESTGLPQSSFVNPSKYIYPSCRGQNISRLFKVLMTNFCQNSCLYCGVRLHRNCRRYIFDPRELAALFMGLYKAKKVDGAFISSGIYKNVDYSQKLILNTVYILRKKFDYHGYIHAKILPSADQHLIRSFSHLADRVSINLEAPTREFLRKICPDKDFNHDILKPIKILSDLNSRGVFKSGLTSQLVVGAQDEKDKDILNTASVLYQKFSLRRVYYSAFTPIEDTPLQYKMPVSSQRQLRLYQADMLIRMYGFKVSDIIFDGNYNLPLDKDPKLCWAYRNTRLFPVNINKAGISLLKCVPGIGLVSADRIIKARRQHTINSFEDFKRLGISIKRTQNWIKFN